MSLFHWHYQVKRAKVQNCFGSLGHNKAIRSCIINGLEIPGFSCKHFYEHPNLFPQKEMPVSTTLSADELAKWPYFRGIQIPCIRAGLGLLIGTNASKLMESWEVINSHGGMDYILSKPCWAGWLMAHYKETMTSRVGMAILQWLSTRLWSTGWRNC